jgi:tetratricopeptide (TPR) repeat protein
MRQPGDSRHALTWATAARPLCALAWVAAPLCVVAQEPAPAAVARPVPALCRELAEQTLTEKTLPQWQAAVPACQYQPQWLASLGNVLNQLGRYREAVDHLERALLLDARLIDAQIDYAIALAGVGDTLSAQGMLASLLETPELPEPMRATLQQQQAALAKGQSPTLRTARWQARAQLGLLVGRDSNLLGAPNIGSLALTLGDITQVLPLESSYLAKAGNYNRTEAAVHARRRETDGPQWDLLASVRHRASPSVPEAGSDQYEIMAERSTIGTRADRNGHGSYVRASAAALDTRLSGRYTVLGLAAGWGRSLSAATPQGTLQQATVQQGAIQQDSATECQLRAGGELQERRYQANPTLSGQYRGLALGWSCQGLALPLQGAQSVQWVASLRAGQDHPLDATRPGGMQTQTSLQLQMQAPAALLVATAQGQWQLTGEWSTSRDATTYSPWLENGAVRHIDKRAARIEYLRSIHAASSGGHWQLQAGVEWAQHQSNLALFGLRSWGPYAGLRFGW